MTNRGVTRPGRRARETAVSREATIDWRVVLGLQCAGKAGHVLTLEEQGLCLRALEADPERYRAQQREAFELTKPFGAR